MQILFQEPSSVTIAFNCSPSMRYTIVEYTVEKCLHFLSPLFLNPMQNKSCRDLFIYSLRLSEDVDKWSKSSKSCTFNDSR